MAFNLFLFIFMGIFLPDFPELVVKSCYSFSPGFFKIYDSNIHGVQVCRVYLRFFVFLKNYAKICKRQYTENGRLGYAMIRVKGTVSRDS